MADAKVSELTSATSAGGSDVFYVVQSNTSKKITAANLFGNISNPTLTGNITIGGTPQALGAPGIISITTPITHLSSDAIGGTLQIPSGTQGQFKLLTMTATAGGSYTVATSNIAGNTSIVFDAVGDTVLLYYTNGKWAPIASSAALDLTNISSNVIPSANSVYDLGSATNQWRSLYVSNNTIFIGGTPLTIENGELVIGSGEASANLATVAYVDGAVANAGGGGGANTGNITFTNTTISAPNESNLVIQAADTGSNLEGKISIEPLELALSIVGSNIAVSIESTADNVGITAGSDVNIVALDDLRLTGNDTVALRNRSNTSPINIITDFDDNQYNWEFGANGTLRTPGDVVVSGDITGFISSTLNIKVDAESNTFIQLNDIVDSSIRTQANLEIRTNGTDPFTWVFDKDGILTLPGNLYFSGCSISAINSVSNSSGDGIGASTLQIVPDNSLFNNDQYIIIDPTEPDHIHIRGGGDIDNCSAKLIIGGENSHFAVQAGANASVGIRANNNNWNFGTDGTLSAPGSISSDGIISTGKSKFDKVVESYSGTVNPTGNVIFDCSSSHIFNVTSINTNFTANITNLDLNDGEATSVTLVLNQGATAYIANALQLSGTTQTIRWQANTVPTGNVNAVDVQTFSILNVGGNYTVLGQLTTFG